MAQNITLLGASYSSVPAVVLPKTGGGTASFTDVTDTTAAAADVATGKYFYTSAGVRTQGTSSGGGGSDVVKVASISYQTSTSQTTAQTLATWSTGSTDLWTSDKIVYVKIRDEAGERNGYFYGSDNFFFNTVPANGTSTTSITTSTRFYTRYNSNAFATATGTSTSGYGVYADTLYKDGRIRIRMRYSSSTSLTIDGSYVVEVYLINVGSLIG